MYKIGRCLLDDRLSAADMTRSQLVERSGISRQAISDYATNRRHMSLTTAVIIATILGCDARDLYEWTSIRRASSRV